FIIARGATCREHRIGLGPIASALLRPQRLGLGAHETIWPHLLQLFTIAAIEQAIVAPILGDENLGLKRGRRHSLVSAKYRRASPPWPSRGSDCPRVLSWECAPADRIALPSPRASPIAHCPSARSFALAPASRWPSERPSTKRRARSRRERA